MLFDVPIRSPELRRCFWKADATLNFTLWPDQGEGANHEKLRSFAIWTAALLCMSGASGLAHTGSGAGHRLTAISLSDGTLNSAAAFYRSGLVRSLYGANSDGSIELAHRKPQSIYRPLNLCRHEKLRLPRPQVQRREPEDRH
jgi:hypothetical protein